MFESKPEVVLLVYGKGGHTAQMENFLKKAPSNEFPPCYITLTNAQLNFSGIIESYFCIDARDKHYWYKNLFVFIAYFIISTIQMIRILLKYNVVGMISTGPGLAVIPAIFCRGLGKKVIFFESWSRFTSPSIAGRIMHRLAHLFFIQHESMQKYYPKSVYMGRL